MFWFRLNWSRIGSGMNIFCILHDSNVPLGLGTISYRVIWVWFYLESLWCWWAKGTVRVAWGLSFPRIQLGTECWLWTRVLLSAQRYGDWKWAWNWLNVSLIINFKLNLADSLLEQELLSPSKWVANIGWVWALGMDLRHGRGKELFCMAP